MSRPRRILLPVTLLASAAALAPARAAGQGPAWLPGGRIQTSGLAVQVETGRYDGGHGVAAAWYQPLPLARLTVGAEAGLGITGSDRHGTAARAHLFIAHGRMHRALASAGWTVVDRDTLRLHGSPALDRTSWGPEAVLGYELLAPTGPLVRGWLALGHVRRPEDTGVDRWRWGLGLALGWKLW